VTAQDVTNGSIPINAVARGRVDCCDVSSDQLSFAIQHGGGGSGGQGADVYASIDQTGTSSLVTVNVLLLNNTTSTIAAQNVMLPITLDSATMGTPTVVSGNVVVSATQAVVSAPVIPIGGSVSASFTYVPTITAAPQTFTLSGTVTATTPDPNPNNNFATNSIVLS